MSRPHVSWWGSGLVYIVSLTATGMVLGIAVATRVMTTTDMGWDQIADALGGLMVGGLAGIAVSTLTLKRFRPRRRMIIAAIALLTLGLTFAYMHIVPPNVATVA